MKNDQLLKAMSQIDDKFIVSAANSKNKKSPVVEKKKKRVRMTSVRWLAAAIALMFVLSVAVVASNEEFRYAVARAYRKFMFSEPSSPAVETLPADEVLKVRDAVNFTREVRDVMTGETLQSYHTITIPEIDRETPGAAALNEKIYNLFYGFVDILEHGEEKGDIYTVSYLAGEQYGVMQIYIKVITAVQYSEETGENYVFYYDKASDRELTYAEFASLAGIDNEKITDAVLNSEVHLRRVEYAFYGFDVGVEGVFIGTEQDEYCRVLVSYTSPEGYVSPVATENVFDRETYENFLSAPSD